MSRGGAGAAWDGMGPEDGIGPPEGVAAGAPWAAAAPNGPLRLAAAPAAAAGFCGGTTWVRGAGAPGVPGAGASSRWTRKSSVSRWPPCVSVTRSGSTSAR